MNPALRQRLQLDLFGCDDIVTHYLRGGIYRVLHRHPRSETLLLLNVETGLRETWHPKHLREVTDPMLVIAASAV